MGQPECETIIQELKDMKQRMDLLFHESLQREAPHAEEPEAHASPWTPAIDVYEMEAGWFLSADLPGVLDNDLHIEITEGVLQLSGSRTLRAVPQGASLHTLQRRSGSFARSFALPADALCDQVEAELKRGVLTVKVPRNGEKSSGARRVLVRME